MPSRNAHTPLNPSQSSDMEPGRLSRPSGRGRAALPVAVGTLPDADQPKPPNVRLAHAIHRAAADYTPPDTPKSASVHRDVEAASYASSVCRRAAADRRSAKIDRHILPALCMVGVAHLLDRTNASYAAAAGMKEDIGLNISQLGLALSLSFVPYSSLQLVATGVGARFGIIRIIVIACVLWGIVSASNAAVTTRAGFYAVRLVLGTVEAPLFPLIMAFLRIWHPSDGSIGVSYSWVHGTVTLANALGAVIAAGILSLDGIGGVRGWRYLFLIEGCLTILVALWAWCALPASPDKARFLTPEEKAALADDMVAARGDRALAPATTRDVLRAAKAALLNWRIVVVSATEGVAGVARFGSFMFSPLLLSDALGAGVPPKKRAVIAALTSIPFGLSGVASVLNAAAAKRAARRGTGRKWFLVWPLVAGAVGLFAVGPALALAHHAATPGTRAAAVAVITLSTMAFASYPVALSLPSTLAGASLADGAMAYGLFNSLAMLGGALGPTILGATAAANGGKHHVGASVLGATSAAAAIVYILFYRWLVPIDGARASVSVRVG